MGPCRGQTGGGRLRGPRRRWQGQHHQARVSQYENPRMARIAALPAPSDRERTQRYFQRYVAQSAGRWRDRAGRPLLVQPSRRRASDGLLLRRRVRAVPCPSARSSSDCWSRTASLCASTGSPSVTPSKRPGSSRALTTRCGAGSSRRWIWNRSRVGRTTPWPRTSYRAHRHRRRAVVGRRERRQAPRPAQYDPPLAVDARLPR